MAIECPECKGKKEVGSFLSKKTCGKCGGIGRISDEPKKPEIPIKATPAKPADTRDDLDFTGSFTLPKG